MQMPLPKSWYTDPDVFRHEREAVYGRSWLIGCHVTDIDEPGDYVSVRVGGHDIILLKSLDGVVRAFHNVCQHRAHRLLDGRGRLKVSIACPYHAWTYGLDGSLRSAPHTDDLPEFDKGRFGLETVRSVLFAGFVMVCFDAAAAVPSASPLGELESLLRRDHPELDGMREVFRREAVLKANWKLIIENYLECYHCDVAHPSFGNFDLGTWKHVVGNGWSRQGRVPQDVDETAIGHDSFTGLSAWWQWPNIFWARALDNDSFVAVTHEPIAPDQTRQTRVVYAAARGASADLRRFNEFFDVVFGEDTSVVESVQRGLGSAGYRGGVLIEQPAARAGWSEHAVHHFQHLLREALGPKLAA